MSYVQSNCHLNIWTIRGTRITSHCRKTSHDHLPTIGQRNTPTKHLSCSFSVCSLGALMGFNPQHPTAISSRFNCYDLDYLLLTTCQVYNNLVLLFSITCLHMFTGSWNQTIMVSTEAIPNGCLFWVQPLWWCNEEAKRSEHHLGITWAPCISISFLMWGGNQPWTDWPHLFLLRLGRIAWAWDPWDLEFGISVHWQVVFQSHWVVKLQNFSPRTMDLYIEKRQWTKQTQSKQSIQSMLKVYRVYTEYIYMFCVFCVFCECLKYGGMRDEARMSSDAPRKPLSCSLRNPKLLGEPTWLTSEPARAC